MIRFFNLDLNQRNDFRGFYLDQQPLLRMSGFCVMRAPMFKLRLGITAAAVGAALSFAAAQAQQPPNIVGSWRDTCNDGRVIVVEEVAPGQFEGRYQAIGGLGAVHFRMNEVGYRLKQDGENEYSGTVKWRWTSGREEWKPNEVVISGESWIDTGSDRCSQRMIRIHAAGRCKGKGEACSGNDECCSKSCVDVRNDPFIARRCQ